MTPAERQSAAEEIPALRRIEAYVCGLCLTSVGAECHVPGCVFWMHDVPTQDTAQALRSASITCPCIDHPWVRVDVGRPFHPDLQWACSGCGRTQGPAFMGDVG